MIIEPTPLAGLLIITPKKIVDARGYFVETFRQSDFMNAAGTGIDFVQENQSFSHESNVIRGLHVQSPPHDQGKLVRCVLGEIFDVAVDIRRASPTYGQWFGVNLSAENGRQIWIPPGFLHGFRTDRPGSVIQYKCSAYYNLESEVTIAWNDPGINIDWGLDEPVLSEKDRNGRDFKSFLSPF